MTCQFFQEYALGMATFQEHSAFIRVETGRPTDIPFSGTLVIPMPAIFSSSGAPRGNLIKILWHDGLGMSLYAKRLERGRFIWPTVAARAIAISPSQLAYMLDRIDWRNPVQTFRPERAG
jgi:transposase